MVRKKEKKIKNEKYLDTNLEKKEKLWKPKLETNKNKRKKKIGLKLDYGQRLIMRKRKVIEKGIVFWKKTTVEFIE